MKNTTLLVSATLLLGVAIGTSDVLAAEYETDGTITFEAGGSEITPPVDPENPDPKNPVDPVDPPSPGTAGPLSIDYGSKIKFGSQKISTTDQTYYAQPDELTDGTKKPTYVQVTDTRGTLAGWKLNLTQPEQFKTADGKELVGAELTFTKAQVDSVVSPEYTPSTVTENLVVEPGAGSVLAVDAEAGTGVGTWVYRFGADTADNTEAVQLFVPGESVKLAQEYTTRLVWSLETTP